MKRNTVLLALAVITSGCAGYQRIGSLTMVSTRNVDTSKTYQLIARAAKGEAKSDNDDAMQQAMDAAVKKYPGGEYLMNAAIYVKSDGRRVKVEGDVWGIASTTNGTASADVTGSVAMSAGDQVLWRKNGTGKPQPATLVAIRNMLGTIEIPTQGKPILKEVLLEHLIKK